MASPAKKYTKPGWLQQLQIGSFRGVEFFTKADGLETGRRIANHEYPYRDQPWPEDMGLATKFYDFDAYLWADETQGETVWDLRNDLLEAVEAEGSDTLVHPSLGSVLVQCMNALFHEDENGGVVACRLRFIESALYTFQGLAPFSTPNTQANVTVSASAVVDGASVSFGVSVTATVG